MRRRRAAQRRSEWSLSRILILTATFFIAAGIGTLGMNTISRMSQMAAVNIGAPKSCEEAIQRALAGEKPDDGPASGSVSGTTPGATKLDECFGAVMMETGKQKKAKGIPLTVEDYKCVGRKAHTDVATNKVSDSSMPSDGLAPGACDRSVTSKRPQGGEPKGDEKGKGGEDKGQEEKGQEKGQPQMPEMPKGEGKPKEQQPQDQKCLQDPNAPECKEEQKPFYCGIPGASLFLSTCSEDHSTQNSSSRQLSTQVALEHLANDDISRPGSASANADATNATVVTDSQLEKQAQRLAYETSGGGQAGEKISAEDGYAPQGFTGFGPANEGLSLQQREESQSALGRLGNTLKGWLCNWWGVYCE